MDKLISNIQQTFNTMNQDNNNKTLLQNQQINQDKINELLEKSSDAIMCGPSCQKLKITEELKKKYLDAETNVKTAPTKLEQTKKNYYVYAEGRTYYDNMREEELTAKAEQISKLLTDTFNDEISNANTMNMYLNTALINSENTKDLLKEYLEKNEVLKLKLRERQGDILTNNRKTYYETEALDRLKLWYSFFWWIYYIVAFILILALIFSPNKLTLLLKVILATAIVFYPYYITYVVKWIYSNILWLKNKIPVNVYNNI